MILFQLSASENIPFSFLDWEEVVLKLHLSANLGGKRRKKENMTADLSHFIKFSSN